MPQTPIAQFLLGLLGSLGLVLALFCCFAIAYRRHLKGLKPSERRLLPRPFSKGHTHPVSFAQPPCWMAVRTTNSSHLRALFGLDLESSPSWSEALSRCHELMLFVSPPVEGWSLVIGGALPDPVEDVDRCYRLLVSLSKEIGEVQFFAADRILNHHTWARIKDGRVQRAYSWVGTTEWNEGKLTADERLLGLRPRDYGEEPADVEYGVVTQEQIHTERVPLLARRWSVDLMAASEIIIHQETMASSDEERDPPDSGPI